MSAKAPAKGTTAKHAAASKHATSTAKSGTKHTPAKSAKPATAKAKAPAKVTTKATQASPAKAAGFAVGDLLPVCSAQALAQSLRLAGQRVTDDDVLELHYRAGGSAGDPVSIADALAAAVQFGLAGIRPVTWDCVKPAIDITGFSHLAIAIGMCILHVDVPGPHAVLATADGWWSWGELYSPWPCRVSEAWAVSWS